MGLAQTALDVAEEHEVELYIAPQLVDTSMFWYSGIPVFAHHCDPVVGNGETGEISVDTLTKLRVKGLLINHSEYPQGLGETLFLVNGARRRGLMICVCIPDEKLLGALRNSVPDFLAVEPPELIGGTSLCHPPNQSYSVFGFVAANMHSTRGICGAGIKKGEDARKAKALGPAGVLVASGYVLVDNLRRALGI